MDFFSIFHNMPINFTYYNELRSDNRSNNDAKFFYPGFEDSDTSISEPLVYNLSDIRANNLAKAKLLSEFHQNYNQNRLLGSQNILDQNQLVRQKLQAMSINSRPSPPRNIRLGTQGKVPFKFFFRHLSQKIK